MPHTLPTGDQSRFHDEGYLVIPGVLSEADLAPVKAEYAQALDAAAERLLGQGLIKETWPDLPFGERYTQIASVCPSVFNLLDISLPVVDAMPPDATMHAGPGVFGLLTHSAVLDIVEDVLGPKITSNPTQHLRLKPPARRLGIDSPGGATSWHQDLAGLLDEALDSDILTVWIGLTETTVENGCLTVIPRSQRLHGHNLTRHVIDGPGGANYIPDDELAPGPITPLPVPRGSVILLHKLTHHGSLPNHSDALRMSLDLRYQPTGEPTGRPAFPGFAVRSTSAPETVVKDAVTWSHSWQDCLETILRDEHPKPLFETARWTGESA